MTSLHKWDVYEYEHIYRYFNKNYCLSDALLKSKLDTGCAGYSGWDWCIKN